MNCSVDHNIPKKKKIVWNLKDINKMDFFISDLKPEILLFSTFSERTSLYMIAKAHYRISMYNHTNKITKKNTI